MLTQKTYRLFLRNAINETGLADEAAILAAIAAIAAANLAVQNLLF